MKEMRKKAIWSGLGIIAVIVGMTTLFVLRGFDVAVLMLGLVACCLMVNPVWNYGVRVLIDATRILRKALPKAGFKIDHIEWDDEHVSAEIYGEYREERFIIRAANDAMHVFIYLQPWTGIETGDTIIPTILEAINDINMEPDDIDVCLLEPNEKGMRQICARCITVLPIVLQADFLAGRLDGMLKRRTDLAAAIRRHMVFPDVKPSRTPMGFNIQPSRVADEETSAASSEESLAASAKPCESEDNIGCPQGKKR